MILKYELSAKNKITATGALAVPVWTDRRTRKVLTTYKMDHPTADTDTLQLHVNRKWGGRGTLQIAVIYRADIWIHNMKQTSS